MVRRYDEAVQVQTTDEAAVGVGEGLGAVPTAFVWRGRPYLVRGVLAHWYERRAWWHAAEAVVQGGGCAATSRTAQGAVPVSGRAHPPAGTLGAADVTNAAEVATECQVWRVEAMAGRSSPVGVYDLTQHPSEGLAARWLLTRLDD